MTYGYPSRPFNRLRYHWQILYWKIQYKLFPVTDAEWAYGETFFPKIKKLYQRGMLSPLEYKARIKQLSK